MPHRRVTPTGPQATGSAFAERTVRIDVSVWNSGGHEFR